MSLVLLPNLLGPGDAIRWLAPVVADAVASLDGLIAESERAGLRYLSAFETKRPAREIPIALMSQRDELDFLLEPVVEGETWGLVSDAGMPCVADPGARVVARARQLGIRIVAYPGPSAMIQALVLSGLPAQRFAFHGYLRRERKAHLLELERRAERDGATQLFMEAPYRNDFTLKDCVDHLKPQTLLGVASSLTSPEEQVVVQTVKRWRAMELLHLRGHPTVFLIGGAGSKGRRGR